MADMYNNPHGGAAPLGAAFDLGLTVEEQLIDQQKKQKKQLQPGGSAVQDLNIWNNGGMGLTPLGTTT